MELQANQHHCESDFGLGTRSFYHSRTIGYNDPAKSSQNKMKHEDPPDKLKKAADNPLPGQVNVTPDPVKIEGFDEDPTWYPVTNLKRSPHLVREFHAANPTKAGPPKRLSKWLETWEKDNYLADEADDNLPA
ncbi:hypothetical protein PAAG_11717 [Paracoccidioides lutzii Pb01]|uniref:Uncharacterized protein n=1 Tax=Paracoccidioides lutzii (strain ATCC MYA-826 / Pb01) TaxID=502779 RepID=A0A0A2VL46_PARBA|nr:hypothetical protein PAAG_11717 [Paracoccidioides lutzii Pb01]KGQ01589.1 hypothetical protein PAAG_11717 [Paracoccidioides lutzii Pb01]